MNSPLPPRPPRELSFGSFRVDLSGQRLWRGGEAVPLRPKSWDVLVYLAERPGVLVTKADVHRAVWGDAAVVEDTLTQSIGELRRALGDNPRKPRFIETVHRRGFRFVAEVMDGEQMPTPNTPGSAADDVEIRFVGHDDQSRNFVGREGELEQLRAALRRAQQAKRGLVFVTGEAGIGKTAFLDEFLRCPRGWAHDVYVLYGQCVQLHGPREPYMPLLEALDHAAAIEVLEPLIEDIEGGAVDSAVPAYGVDPTVAVRMQSGLARWFLGFPEQARAHARAGLNYAETKGSPFDQASALTQLAMIELFSGDTRAASRLAARDATICDEKGIAFFAPLSRFLCGACPVQQGEGERGLEELLLSLDEQQSRSLELRAATSLARLLRKSGARRQARELLEPIYAAFTEGFDTKDLTDARTLLSTLHGGSV